MLESKAALCVPLKDVKSHEDALLEFLKRFEQKSLSKTPEEFVKKFNRVSLTGELAKVLETLMDIDHNAFLKVDEGEA